MKSFAADSLTAGRAFAAVVAGCLLAGCSALQPKTVDGGTYGYVVSPFGVQFRQPQSFAVLPLTPDNLISMPEVDLATFVVLEGHHQHLAKDKNHVYHQTDILPGADPATYRLVGEEGNAGRAMYSADANAVWRRDKRIDGADPASFRLVGQAYSADAKSVWLAGDRIASAQPASFRVLSWKDRDGVREFLYSTDGAGVWWGPQKVAGADGGVFRTIADNYGTDGVRTYHADKVLPGVSGDVTFLSGGWLRDGTGAIFRVKWALNRLDDTWAPADLCDAATFVVASKVGMASDADDKCVYYNGERIPLTDRASYQLVWGEWSKDKGAVFFKTTRVDGADPASAEIVTSVGSGPMLRDGSGRCWQIEGKLRECPGNLVPVQRH